MDEKKRQINLTYAMLAILMVLAFQSWWATTRQVETVPYSQFEEMLKHGELEQIRIRDRFIEGKLKSPQPDGHHYVITTRVDPVFAEHLAQYDVDFTGVVESTVLRDLLSWILPVFFFVAIWMFVIRRMAEKQGLGGLMSVGKSHAKVYVETSTGVTFADVAGVDEAKAELKEVVDFLGAPQEYGRLGARIPNGVLLVGPPGTGKTLLARAVAGQAGVPFFSISGSEFVEMFVGVGAARVRDLFEQAHKAAPAIIFIDELDALGRARGIGNITGGHDEKEQTLNQLLAELDGFDPRTGVVLLAATNRPEVLDAALLRAGRFDRQILVDRPDKLGRIQILEVHINKIKRATDINLEHIASITTGFTGADLANLVNEAALLATRRRGDDVTLNDFNDAIERIVAGIEKRSRVLNEAERRTVAYHEMGHALVAASLPGMDPVHKISIIPRGIGALGYTIQHPTEDRFLMSRQTLRDKMSVLMGGRAAESIVFDEISTGATDDLDKITEIARHMVMRFGMDDDIGQVVYDQAKTSFLGEGLMPEVRARNYSEATAKAIDAAVKTIVSAAFERAKEILVERREELDSSAILLLQKETLTAGDLPWLGNVRKT